MPRMEWAKLLSQKRIGKKEQDTSSSNGRTMFESDVDRIIFSGAFRRLSRKTQVHPLAPNDHIHNRLTHSLEVARVGAALGQAIGRLLSKKNALPENIKPADIGTIVHAACLAHDIGNPPFGHAGESAIKNWFMSEGPAVLSKSALDAPHKDDLYHYEGNAQGFRIITQTENHLFNGGLRLTAATLGTFLKYPWTINQNRNKFGSFLSEANMLKTVANETGLIKKPDKGWSRHPLAFLVEADDDICYGILDLEDGVELRIISFDEVFDVLTTCFENEKKERIKATFAPPDAYRINLSRLRGEIFDELIAAAIVAFETMYEEIMAGQLTGDLFGALPNYDPRRHIAQSASALSNRKIYGDAKKVEIELGSSSTFSHLLGTFCNAALRCSAHLSDPDRTVVDWKSKLVLRLLGDHSPLVAKRADGENWNDYQCIRRVLDFVGA
ncbi:MAG: deoxyguanosinetriphosphate triphosphohydrolase [Candidatus Brocadiaceae bacterium]|nr:deoxyguanosinetriphosphate triphosphohydrolase [Candidatus Brocadiaceae bacterium]MCR4338233.1 deoxyguanosinetriphosphate triphosphohydrolase [Candidatus Omnitrophota bacterium]